MPDAPAFSKTPIPSRRKERSNASTSTSPGARKRKASAPAPRKSASPSTVAKKKRPTMSTALSTESTKTRRRCPTAATVVDDVEWENPSSTESSPAGQRRGRGAASPPSSLRATATAGRRRRQSRRLHGRDLPPPSSCNEDENTFEDYFDSDDEADIVSTDKLTTASQRLALEERRDSILSAFEALVVTVRSKKNGTFGPGAVWWLVRREGEYEDMQEDKILEPVTIWEQAGVRREEMARVFGCGPGDCEDGGVEEGGKDIADREGGDGTSKRAKTTGVEGGEGTEAATIAPTKELTWLANLSSFSPLISDGLRTASFRSATFVTVAFAKFDSKMNRTRPNEKSVVYRSQHKKLRARLDVLMSEEQERRRKVRAERREAEKAKREKVQGAVKIARDRAEGVMRALRGDDGLALGKSDSERRSGPEQSSYSPFNNDGRSTSAPLRSSYFTQPMPPQMSEMQTSNQTYYPALTKAGVLLGLGSLDVDNRGNLLRELLEFNRRNNLDNVFQTRSGKKFRVAAVPVKEYKDGDKFVDYMRRTGHWGNLNMGTGGRDPSDLPSIAKEYFSLIHPTDEDKAADLLAHYLARKHTASFFRSIPVAKEMKEQKGTWLWHTERPSNFRMWDKSNKDDKEAIEWNLFYSHLKLFHDEMGHACVPVQSTQTFGRWVAKQRQLFKDNNAYCDFISTGGEGVEVQRDGEWGNRVEPSMKDGMVENMPEGIDDNREGGDKANDIGAKSDSPSVEPSPPGNGTVKNGSDNTATTDDNNADTATGGKPAQTTPLKNQTRTISAKTKLWLVRAKLLQDVNFEFQISRKKARSGPEGVPFINRAVAVRLFYPQYKTREALLLAGATEEDAANVIKQGTVNRRKIHYRKGIVSKASDAVTKIMRVLEAGRATGEEDKAAREVFGDSPCFEEIWARRGCSGGKRVSAVPVARKEAEVVSAGSETPTAGEEKAVVNIDVREDAAAMPTGPATSESVAVAAVVEIAPSPGAAIVPAYGMGGAEWHPPALPPPPPGLLNSIVGGGHYYT